MQLLKRWCIRLNTKIRGDSMGIVLVVLGFAIITYCIGIAAFNKAAFLFEKTGG